MKNYGSIYCRIVAIILVAAIIFWMFGATVSIYDENVCIDCVNECDYCECEYCEEVAGYEEVEE